MSKHWVMAGVLVLAITAAGDVDAARGIIGKWRAHSMTAKGQTRTMPKGMSVTVEFQKGGTFIGTMEAQSPKGPPRKKVEKGTWKVEGDTLTTTTKKTESMKFKVKGGTLTLTKPDRDEQLTLKRIK
jgi:uncharacterized protein (TIGR03066 family)